MQSIIRYPHAVSPSVFWEKVFFDATYQKRLHLEVLGATDFEILEQSGTVESGIHRRVRFTMAAEVPPALKRLVGEGLTNTEDGRFDPTASVFRYEVTPSKMADKLKIGGEMRAEDRGAAGMERVVVVNIQAKILGLGKVVESFIDQSVRDSHVKVRAFTDEWIREQGLA